MYLTPKPVLQDALASPVPSIAPAAEPASAQTKRFSGQQQQPSISYNPFPGAPYNWMVPQQTSRSAPVSPVSPFLHPQHSQSRMQPEPLAKRARGATNLPRSSQPCPCPQCLPVCYIPVSYWIPATPMLGKSRPALLTPEPPITHIPTPRSTQPRHTDSPSRADPSSPRSLQLERVRSLLANADLLGLMDCYDDVSDEGGESDCDDLEVPERGFTEKLVPLLVSRLLDAKTKGNGAGTKRKWCDEGLMLVPPNTPRRVY